LDFLFPDAWKQLTPILCHFLYFCFVSNQVVDKKWEESSITLSINIYLRIAEP
jgi:hypothetical protein